MYSIWKQYPEIQIFLRFDFQFGALMDIVFNRISEYVFFFKMNFSKICKNILPFIFCASFEWLRMAEYLSPQNPSLPNLLFVKHDQINQVLHVHPYDLIFGIAQTRVIRWFNSRKSQGSNLCWNTLRSEQPRRCHVRPPGEEVGPPNRETMETWEAFGVKMAVFTGALVAHVPRRCHEILRTPMCPTSGRGRRWHLGDRFWEQGVRKRKMAEDVTSFATSPHGPIDMWILPQWPWFSLAIFRTDKKNKFDRTEIDYDRTSHGSWVVGTRPLSFKTLPALQSSYNVIFISNSLGSTNGVKVDKELELWHNMILAINRYVLTLYIHLWLNSSDARWQCPQEQFIYGMPLFTGFWHVLTLIPEFSVPFFGPLLSCSCCSKDKKR